MVLLNKTLNYVHIFMCRENLCISSPLSVTSLLQCTAKYTVALMLPNTLIVNFNGGSRVHAPP